MTSGGGATEVRFPSLADEAVALRPWRQADVAAQLAAFADPTFTHFSDWAPRSEAAAVSALVEQDQLRIRGEQIDFALAQPGNLDLVLGGATVHSIDSGHHRAAVGYWLAPTARGRGVATRAVRLIARWAFEDLRLARLELTCGPDNAASQQVAKRCGFTREGLLRSHQSFQGGRRDSVVFGLLPGELR